MGKFSKFIVDTGRAIKEGHQTSEEPTGKREVGKHDMGRSEIKAPLSISQILFSKTHRPETKPTDSIPPKKQPKLSDLVFGNVVRDPNQLDKPKEPVSLFKGSQDDKAKGEYYEKVLLEKWFEKHPKIQKWQIMGDEKKKREILESLVGSYKKEWYSKRPIRIDIKQRKEDLTYDRGTHGTDKYGYRKKEEARKELEILRESDPKFKKAA